MAAFGIMTALRERDGGAGSPGSGEGQFVDASMSDGALSWLALVAGAFLADGTVPHRGELPLAGALVCYRPYECADGWVTLGALEPKFWQNFCRGVGREELIASQFERPGSDAHAAVKEIFRGRSRGEWTAFAAEHDCCLEPVLGLDEALRSELARAREMVVRIEQPGAERQVEQLGIPVKLGRTPGEHGRLPGPVLGEHTEAVLLEGGYSEAEVADMLRAGAVAGPSEARSGASFRA
jgi:crotonobetainyl-CoA:carnitine CoA-transferase CaiB-like acyl-CoA transferase